MAIEQHKRKCNFCCKEVKSERNRIDHVLHFLISTITLGLWVNVWMLLIIINPYKCNVCSKKTVGIFHYILIILIFIYMFYSIEILIPAFSVMLTIMRIMLFFIKHSYGI